MNGKVCVVTGANAGLGFETAKALAGKKAEVVMICRSSAKGEAARTAIVEATDNEKVQVVEADLSSQSEIREAAGRIRQDWPKVDVLVNNAATVISDHTLTEDDVETQFAVNHLAYFLFTSCLMPALQKSERARIVNISSGNHVKGDIHFDNLNLIGEYQVLKAYNQSKLANVLFTYELDRRLKEAGTSHLDVHCVNPGLNNTDIGIKSTKFLHSLAWRIRRAMGKSPARGAQCQIFVATAPVLDGISGKYWYRSEEVLSSEASYDPELARRLWEVSAELCSVGNYFLA